ncbi:hypothetical protein QQX98_013128 [Neonectria punicea]|uniref:HNH nuclease domain-containing protein n=1 Tax=Neonectria punicea TaxID=979145 RepID=A0ABR1GH73_9HYPO
MPPAAAHNRHRSSLEGIIDFSTQASLTPAQRLSAGRRFTQLVDHFDVPNSGSIKGYDRVKLVRLTYEYARSKESKDNFLRAFFEFAELPMNEDEDINIDLGDADRRARLRDSLFDFAEYLFENFFLPLKACTKKTPQPSPAAHSAIQRVQGEGHAFSGTPERVSALRAACLDPSKEVALKILNMFDSGAAFLVEGTEIDRPRNAMTLAHHLHHVFGEFKIFFEPVDDQPYTYRIDMFGNRFFLGNLLPVTRTLYLTESRTIDPPSARLLAIHNAIAHILHLSAAGEYIDKILRDLEEYGVRADGSTELDRFVKLRLDGWPVGEVGG